ncbi:O-antigen ligase family protein [Bryobacter aggregatus]|uniref:O-antigen ligase family protein n=1 Tax=Bryobacter aggregatus TaxID=360054 RepID=UPI0004E1E5B1|nr:O-antigen ligase family protein [Bryobacter aggregatus]
MSSIVHPHPQMLTVIAGDFPRLRRVLLVLFFAALPLSKVVLMSGKAINFSFADLLLPPVFGLLACLSITGNLKLPFLTISLLNCGLVLASALLNMETGLLTRGQTSNLVELIKWFVLWAYFYAAINLMPQARDFRLGLLSWVLSSAAVAALGVGGSLFYQLTGIQNPFSLHYRAQGTFEDSNLFATYVSASMLLAILYRRISGYRASWIWLIIGLDLCAVVLSASRGALLALTLGFGFLWLFFTSLRMKIAIASLAGIVILLALASPGQKEFLASNPITQRLATTTVNVNNPEAEQRKWLWSEAIQTWKEHPFFGAGRGNHGPKLPGGKIEIPAAHNTYLGLLAELGVFGFLSLAVLVAAIAYPLLWTTGTIDRFSPALLITSLLMFALNGMTINLENCRALWVLFAICTVFTQNRREILGVWRDR